MKNILKMVLASLFLTTFLCMSLVSCKREVPGAKEAAAKKEADAKAAKEAEGKEGGKDEPKPTEKDTDGDKVPDTTDKCKDIPAKVDANKNGCDDELDTDSDGLVDDKDVCPKEKPTTDKNPVDGCEDKPAGEIVDEDNDGVPDDKDKCPGEKSTRETDLDKDGCNSTEEKEAYTKKQAEANVLKTEIKEPQAGKVTISFYKGETELPIDEFEEVELPQGLSIHPKEPNDGLTYVIHSEQSFKVTYWEACGEVETQSIEFTFKLAEEDKLKAIVFLSEEKKCQAEKEVPAQFSLAKLVQKISIPEDVPAPVDGEPADE